ncbi:cytochrome b N-terminal domain-containing protein [Blastococcus saxobsidens]|uniref:Cytochrome bc1 complex cytochrome b subunit n=1 Tax=Blastococcus saxobsidens (strain DD2) TaxID=1146883 RepID=H6RNK3_BLASD|nr:cytochrome b N-terminal domain-containing protein [Blastococcus saxobsidens]CCG03950.1 putative Cytochrome b subunit of the bc complex [Blastococcus saxobsidens DD2]
MTVEEREQVSATRKGAPRWLRELVVPTHWSMLLGPVAVVCFLVLLLTGAVLTFFYEPSAQPVVYEGSSSLYAGRELPAAFSSVVTISEDVPGGLLLRRVHRAASYLFLAAILGHLLRVLLGGAFRGRRASNYLLGLVLLLVAIALGWSGQNLIYDVVTGSSVRIGYTIAASIPWLGPELANLVFAGPDVDDVVPRLFWLHVLVLPVVFVVLLGGHLWLVVRQRHTVLPRRRSSDGRPVVATSSGAGLRSRLLLLGLLTTAVLVLAAVLVPFGDILHIGPFLPGFASNDMYPDWYLLFAEGGIALIPAVELTVLGTTITNPFLGGVLLPGLVGAVLLLLPLVERLFRRRPAADLDVSERAVEAPGRVAFVTAIVVLLVLLSLGAASAVIAEIFVVSARTVVQVFRVAVVVAPLLSAAVAYWYARRQRG